VTALGKGVRVKRVKNGEWHTPDGCLKPGPMHGSVWTVLEVDSEFGLDFISLQEWQNPLDTFDARCFAPLDGNEDLSELEAALKKGPVNGERDGLVRVVERVR
jgi:hypothetical protein